MPLTFAQLTNDQWQAAAPQFLDYNYRQILGYSQAMADRHGARSEHYGLLREGCPVALAEVRVKTIPFLPTGLAYINGGPLTRSPQSIPDALSLIIQNLRTEFVQRRRYTLRIAPALCAGQQNSLASERFANLGFYPAMAVPPYRTMILDLTRPLPDIRAALHQKWRNCLNAAEKRGVTISTSTDPNSFTKFSSLFEHFVDRKQFPVDLDAEFFSRLQSQLPPSEQFQITLAEYQGQPIAGHLASFLGDTAVYLLGASDPLALQLKAPYLLQWHVIMHAHASGMIYYDLGGIDPIANPGTFHFKAGLGGADVTAPGPFECAPSPFRSRLLHTSEHLYRTFKHLKTHPRKPAGHAMVNP